MHDSILDKGSEQTAASHLSAVWPLYFRLEVVSGSGAVVRAVDGSDYLDFTSGVGVTTTGHCHPKIVEAICDQARVFIHAQVNCYQHPLLESLTNALAQLMPEGVDRFFFTNSGAEGVESAVKLARQASGRPNVIVFQGGFHGRTAQTMAMSSSKVSARAGYSPLPGGVYVAPYPYPFRTGDDCEVASARCLDTLRLILRSQTSPVETAAIVIEPVLGEGGYVVPPVSFLRGVQQICRDHDISFVLDEIQSGAGRTGRFLALEHFDLQPDIIVMAKGLASGFPFAAVAARASLDERWPPGSHGGTYGGNPLGCAAALATIDVIRSEGLLENAIARGEQLRSGLRSLQRRHPAIGDIRGLGLMNAIELVSEEDGPDRARADAVREYCFERGRLILLSCGTDANVIRIIPPLVVTSEQIDAALSTLAEALDGTA